MKIINKALLSTIILAWFYSNCFSQATLSIATLNSTPGNSISVQIQATGITDMTGFQFSISYDKTRLSFVNCTNWVSGLNASQVQINPLDGKLTFVYTDAPVNIVNGKFFVLNFTIINGSSGIAAVSWSDSPTQRELSNSIPNEISCLYTDGGVSISSLSSPVAGAATNITQTSFYATWNPSANATFYRLDVALDNGFTNYLTGYQNKDVGNVTTFQVSECAANTIYYYRVKAYNTGETSGVSNTINLTTMQSSTSFPYIVDFTPEDGGTGFINPLSLLITFNENVFAGSSTAKVNIYEQSTLNSNILVYSTPINPTMISSNLVLIPINYKLLDNTIYTVLVDNGIVKNASNSLSASGITDPTIWNFKMGDHTPPKLMITAPASPISTNFIIGFSFDEIVTGFANSLVVTNGIVDQITGSGKEYSVSISAVEKASVVVTIGNSVIDAAGNKFAGKTLTYTTGDFTAPKLVTITPTVDNELVDNHPNFKMTFSEDVKLGAGGNLVVYKLNTTVPTLTIPITEKMIVGKDVTVIYTTLNGLNINTRYYVLVDGTALKDNAGNNFIGINDASIWNFNTGASWVTGVNFIRNGSLDFKVFPNPVTNELTIELVGITNMVDFEIINSLGQVIFTGKVLESTVVPTTNFTPGIYLIKLKSGKTFEFKKIIKN